MEFRKLTVDRYLKRLASKFNRIYIKPKSHNVDEQRREYIFNIIVGFFTVAALATTISSGINHMMRTNAHQANSIPVTFGFFLFTAILWWLSRRGYFKVGAYILVTLVWLASFQLALAWSLELPMAQLMSVLVIVLAGIMISSRASLVVALVTCLSTLLLGYLETSGIIAVDITWLTKHLEFSDAIGLVVIYSIVGAITWLSNNEIDNLLRRAWRSEAALAKERDQLEITVAKRTKELERVQLERTLQLQNLAEYGQISASLIHDLATPVTAASLSLEQVDNHGQDSVVAQVVVSIQQIQEYIANARKQLQGGGQKQSFSVSKEILDVVSLLANQAQTAGVRIKVTDCSDDIIVGDATAFNRVIANMLVNAIQACAPRASERNSKKQHISVEINRIEKQLQILVQDSGIGITHADLAHIFDDFYSTKKLSRRGIGLGLASAKRTIEQDFGGSIAVESAPRLGTTFTIGIPHHGRPDRSKRSKRS